LTLSLGVVLLFCLSQPLASNELKGSASIDFPEATHEVHLLHHFELRAGRDLRTLQGDAGKHLLTRTYADFSEALIRNPEGAATCPFLIPRDDAQQTTH
jgi:hypothetical protein